MKNRPDPDRLRLCPWPGAASALLALILAIAWLPATAQWVWRDSNGRVTASDRPPPRDVADKDILTRPPVGDARRAAAAAAATADAASAAAGNPVVAAAPPAGDRELEARKRAAEQEQSARQRAEEARVATLRAENCRRARGHVAALEGGQRIVRTNEKGEREVLDDGGRAEELRAARTVITADCK